MKNVVPSLRPIVADLQGVLSELWQDGKGWILVTVSAGWFLSLGVRYVYPSLLPFFRSEFNLDLTTTGLLLTALWGAYAIGQFPGGVLGDRIGEGNILVFSTGLSMVAVSAVTVSFNAWMLFAGTVAFGFGTALYGPTRFTIFTDIYSDRSGIAVGFTMAAGSIGNTILPVVAGVVATYLTWRLSFGILLPFFLGSTIALWLALPGRTSGPDSAVDELSLHAFRQIITGVKREGIPVVVSIQVIAGFVSQGFLGFYPTYLIDVKGFSPELASTLFGLYFAIGILVQPLSGISRDQFGSRVTLVVLLGLYSISLAILPFVNSAVLFFVLTVMLSSRNGTGVINNTFIADSLPERIRGSGLGLLRTGWILLGAISPVFIGFLADSGHFEDAFLLLAVLAGLATLLALFVPEQQAS